MQKTCTVRQTLLTTHCDMLSTWRPSAILESMQDASGQHCEQLGIGHDALRSRGLVWVVNRYELVMEHYPRFGDTVLVETFPLPTRHGFYPRYYAFRGEEGQEYGYGCGLWSVLDLEKRAMVSGPLLADDLPDNRDLQAKLKMPALAKALDAEPECDCFLPRFTDLDDNRHVNNTKYVDWCVNALGIETMSQNELARFIVNYHREIRPGQQVSTELRREDGRFSYQGFVNGETHFAISGEMRKR